METRERARAGRKVSRRDFASAGRDGVAPGLGRPHDVRGVTAGVTAGVTVGVGPSRLP